MLKPREGFDWSRLTWGRPDSVVSLCSYCSAVIPDDPDYVPLILWDSRGYTVKFCEKCMERWWGFEPMGEDNKESTNGL